MMTTPACRGGTTAAPDDRQAGDFLEDHYLFEGDSCYPISPIGQQQQGDDEEAREADCRAVGDDGDALDTDSKPLLSFSSND